MQTNVKDDGNPEVKLTKREQKQLLDAARLVAMLAKYAHDADAAEIAEKFGKLATKHQAS